MHCCLFTDYAIVDHAQHLWGICRAVAPQLPLLVSPGCCFYARFVPLLLLLLLLLPGPDDRGAQCGSPHRHLPASKVRHDSRCA
jgi:hypothetical protein